MSSRWRSEALWLEKLLLTIGRPIVRALVRFTIVPKSLDQLGLDRGKPILYALHVRQLSAAVVLDDALKQAGLPLASAPFVNGSVKERLSMFFLTRSGQPSPLQRNPYEYSKRLRRVVLGCLNTIDHESQDVQIVPVSLFWGRSPTRQDSLWKEVFADSWATPGVLRQGLRLLIHGRQTLVRFGDPISLRSLLADTQDIDTAMRRVGRVLRGFYKQERELAVGPNLSHRQTLVNGLIQSDNIRHAIAREAERKSISLEAAEGRARRMAVEIASHYSYGAVRIGERLLSVLWNRLYNGVQLHRFDQISRLANAGVVYVPSHRSHIDYLLLSYTIFHQGLQVPHIAAGDNLNLPVLGSLLRRCGAFFLRRSFKGDALYSAIFSDYLNAILRRGFPIEYFIEGGRSRTGKMLSPKAGMLAMTVDSFRQGIDRPLVLVPIYIGYEKLMEGDTYIAELSGKPKERESILGLLLTLRKLKEHYGKVHVNVGEPIALSAHLDLHWPEWKTQGELEPSGEAKRRRAIAALGEKVIVRINDAFVLNPVNLIALAMLGAPRQTIDANRCAELIDKLRQLLIDNPYSERQEISALSGNETIAYAERNGIVVRQTHPLGDLLQAVERQASLLTYFRNNVLHAYAAPALLAGLIAQGDRIEVNQVHALTRTLFPFLRSELFLSWSEDELQTRFDGLIEWFVQHGLAIRQADTLLAPSPQESGSVLLHALARCLRQPLQRYFIVLETLIQFGNNRLTARQLEDICFLLAQRVAFLHEAAAPEFFDRSAFRSIIQTLQADDSLRVEKDRLVITEQLKQAAEHSRFLLSSETRLAIAHATSVSPEQWHGQDLKAGHDFKA